MGLDVTAYRQLKKLDALFDADGEPVDPTTREPSDNFARFYVNHDFPGREGSIEDKAVYAYGGAESFWSGGYGRYNNWREQLAELAGYPLHEYKRFDSLPAEMRRDAAAWAGLCDGLPFVELVNFSDCEGVIGPEVAAKLAKDFQDWTERAKAFGDEHFFEKFMEWRRCFEFAADGGAVDFR